MNTGTIYNAKEAIFLPDVLKVSPSEFVNNGRTAGKPEEQHAAVSSERRGLFHFLAELRRRRVCRAITMYSIAM